jgi:regulatory protein
LKEQGLIDDVAFARQWKENRESFSPRGRIVLKRELGQKGVSEEITAAIVSEVDEDTGAYYAAQKKARALPSGDYQSFRNTLLPFLRRRGFSYEVCRHTVNHIWRENNYGEQDA